MFRERALQRVSSPEQLDQVVRAALPLQWVALVTLLTVVAAAVIWAAVTTVPTTLPAQGLYLPTGGLYPVETPLAGTVSGLPPLHVGARVTDGEPLATVTAPTPVDSATPPQSFEVTSPQAGTVVDVNEVFGTYLGVGQTIALVEPAGRPLVVYSYLPTEKASGLAPGVTAEVTFGAGIGATFGYAKGQVLSVSRYPVDLAHVTALTENTSVVNEVATLGPAKEVIVGLETSAAPSGLVWASGHGPPGKVPPGTPVSVKFVVGAHHPISDVL